MTVTGDMMTPAKQGGLFEDVIDVFVRPATLFDRVRDQSFVRPALVQTVIFVVLVLACRNLVTPFFDAEFARSMQQAAAKGQPIPEGAQAMGSKIAGFMSVAGPILAPWFVAILGGLATWIGARVVGAKLSYGQSATIASWAATPLILGYIALAVQGAMVDASTIRGVSDGQIGPARLLDPNTASPPLLALLTQLDVFSIWGLVITAIGVATVARTVRSTGALAALIRFALGALTTVVPALLR